MTKKFVELISNIDILKNVLVNMGLIELKNNIEVVPLTGGVSSSIFKVQIENGHAFCVKQALPKLKVAKDWFAPVERVFGEIDWLQTVEKISPRFVPKVLGVDRETGCFAMTFLPPEESRNWKTELLQGNIDVNFAKNVGENLVLIHRRTANNEELAKKFDYDNNFYSIRLEPYLFETARVHQDLSPILLSMLERTQKTKLALVHGDVSPKNILVGKNGPIFIDAECAWYGDPAFDMAFCLNHLLIKSLWNPTKSDAYLEAFSAQSNAYLQGINWEKVEDYEYRVATLLPAFSLARVDGKSPVEYLNNEQRDRLRTIAIQLIKNPVTKLDDIKQVWKKELLV